MNPNYPKQDRLFRYLTDIVDITTELIQTSCDNHIQNQVHPKSSMATLCSLKINDYKNNKGTQTKQKTGVRGC